MVVTDLSAIQAGHKLEAAKLQTSPSSRGVVKNYA
jgi:hypothetical protein